MKINLERIGAIQSASIDLVGLTVIAGENDTGKSTIGKVSFALVQAFSTFPIAVKKNASKQIRRNLESIYFLIRQSFDLAQYPEIRSFFSTLRLHSEDAYDIPYTKMMNLLQTLELEANEQQLARLDTIRSRIQKIQAEFDDVGSNDDAIARLIHRALSSEFAGEIQYASSQSPAKISLIDGATTVLEMKTTNSEVLSFSGGDPLGFRDATLVEGPAIIQFHSTIRHYDGVGLHEPASYRGAIPYHVVDLANKLRGGGGNEAQPERVCNVFAGDFFFDDEKENFYLQREGLRIPSVNIASGIKALSIIEILNSNDYIDSDTLLILDEPETNLHPTWQIAYAKAICELAKRGARILVTTHSPYILEALKGYADESVESKFYLAKKEEDGIVNYIDTNGDISSIIESLAQPLADFLKDINDDNF